MEEFRIQVSSSILPTHEIAKLAAVLAYGRPIDSQSLSFIAAQAIELLDKCEDARKSKINTLAIYARAEAIKNRRPSPKTFPVSFDDFLRLAMPKKRPEDRYRLFKEWTRTQIRFTNYMEKERVIGKKYEDTPIPSDGEIAPIIERDKSEGFPEFWFHNAYATITKWLSDKEAENRLIRAKAGAEGLKKKRKTNG